MFWPLCGGCKSGGSCHSAAATRLGGAPLSCSPCSSEIPEIRKIRKPQAPKLPSWPRKQLYGGVKMSLILRPQLDPRFW